MRDARVTYTHERLALKDLTLKYKLETYILLTKKLKQDKRTNKEILA